MSEFLKVEGHKDLIKDTTTHAVINTNRNALDYIYEKHNLNSSSQINISMSSGGGYSAIFKKSP